MTDKSAEVIGIQALGMIETRGFVGMVEAPLLIRPYLERLSRAELFAVMTVGMAGTNDDDVSGAG
mgnify:CR=1 FL=1